MNRTFQILAWGLAGILLTGVLTGAAVAVAGNGIATPARPFTLTSTRVEQPLHEAPEQHQGGSGDQGKVGSGPSGEPIGGQDGDSTSGSSPRPETESSGSGSGDSDGSDEGSGGNHDGDDGDDDD